MGADKLLPTLLAYIASSAVCLV